jgi:hypothetical protein
LIFVQVRAQIPAEETLSTYWTNYWTRECVSNMKAAGDCEGRQITRSAGNLFTARGVKAGDALFILSATQKKLFLIGRMVVRGVMPYETYCQRYRVTNLWEADEVAHGSGTPCRLEHELPDRLLRDLYFINERGRCPWVQNGRRIDAQAFRGLHRLDEQNLRILNTMIMLEEEDLRDQ